MKALDGEAAAKAMLVWMEREEYLAAKQQLHQEEAAHRAQVCEDACGPLLRPEMILCSRSRYC